MKLIYYFQDSVFKLFKLINWPDVDILDIIDFTNLFYTKYLFSKVLIVIPNCANIFTKKLNEIDTAADNENLKIQLQLNELLIVPMN